ncbi:MAG: oxidoreductase [Robiginitomaculum sp.]|nr:MAG: oxidoreductase [Robiginitomaculum sp.]
MTEKSLRIGVIGAGVFGNFHAGKCAAHPRLDLVGIFDPNHDKVRLSAQNHNTRAFDNCNTLLSGVDAVIVACPAVHHGPIALAALRAGRHVLVEKPIANTLETARDMVQIAQDKNLVLQVGHQERFVGRAIGLDKAPKRPVHINATRFGPVSDRGTDVSVTLDLMIHDFDMAAWLMGSQPVKISGETVCVYSELADTASVGMEFEGGGTASLEASRAKGARERIMHIEYPDGVLRIDFVNKTFEDTTGYGFNSDFANDPMAKDSLGSAVNAFTQSVLDGTPVAVPGIAGLNALDLALQIDSMNTETE